jgi:rod shape determining protein RodA
MLETPLNERRPRLDWVMLIALFGLMVVGTLFIASATRVNESGMALPFWRHSWFKAIVYYCLGLGLGGLACAAPYHTLARWSYVAYWIMMALLVAVLVVGAVRYGARRWIDLGPFQFQPSEFAKLAFILALAQFLGRPRDELQSPPLFLKALGLIFLPFALILREPDLGSALVFFPAGLVMMFVAGVPGRYLWRLVAGVGVVIAVLVVDVLYAPPKWQIRLEPYQRKRLLVYFGKSFVPPRATEAERQRALREYHDAAYNVEQALISVGSGGLTGKGWRQGTQNALGYLPRAVAHNDFIFSVIAEESGFAGSVAVLALYGVVLFCGLNIAGQARDRLGKLLAVGVVTLLFCHVFINIGMNIRLVPVTGIPLPLLSSGGTSVVSSLVAAGLLQNVRLLQHTY